VAKEAEKAARMEASLALKEEKCQTLTSLSKSTYNSRSTLVNSGFSSSVLTYTKINSLLLQLDEGAKIMQSEKERTLEAELVTLKSLFEDNKLACVGVEEMAKYFNAANFKDQLSTSLFYVRVL
jgi:hypothetical protein